MSSQISSLKPTVTNEIIWRQLDDNAVIVSPQTGEVRVLNEVGTLIWQMLTDRHSVADIVNHLANNYQVTPQQAQQDVALFLQELHERGLVQWPAVTVNE
ncbi:MAG: PqqD family protein [Chloroflexota bacterium]|jgi:hypothetical protein